MLERIVGAARLAQLELQVRSLLLPTENQVQRLVGVDVDVVDRPFVLLAPDPHRVDDVEHTGRLVHSGQPGQGCATGAGEQQQRQQRLSVCRLQLQAQ